MPGIFRKALDESSSMSQPLSLTQFPLHELLAFEAAARNGSFLKAADELSVTQSAISHRVINFEKRLGVTLFVRRARGIALTEDGERYLNGVSSALTSLWAAGEELRLAEHAVVRVATAPSFGIVWLLPRLPEYLRANPTVQIDVSTVATPEDVSRQEWDVLVHFGAGGADARRVHLLTDEVMAVAVPDLLPAGRTQIDAAHLRDIAVLRHTLLDWSAWCAGACGKKAEPRRYIYFDDSVTMLEAAVSGAGMALATKVAAAPYLANGQLVQVHPFVLTDNDYYAQVSESGELKPASRSFVDWLVRLAAQSQASK
jgi:LysR family transcriptional regulator, glycine cleavage system transcriptional activator